MQFEYRVVPAPKRGLKARGVKGSEAMFALALETAMNELGAAGWDYVRADTLPCEERSGLTGRTTVYQNMLVFRRAKPEAVTEAPAEARKALAPPLAVAVTPPPAPSIPAPAATDNTLLPPAPPVGPATGPLRLDPPSGPRLAAE